MTCKNLFRQISFFCLSLLMIVGVAVASPRPIYAQKEGADQGTNTGNSPAAPSLPAWKVGGVCVGKGESADVATIQGVQCIVANILSIAVSGLGLIGFVMMLIGGFTYMLSGSNSKGADTARQTITFAVAGIIVALSAFIILRLIASFTGVDTILRFQIPNSDKAF